MRKFDANDPITWILQMEQFFDPHQVTTLQKVPIASLYLEPEKIIKTRIKRPLNQTIIECLAKWKNVPIKDVTWEDGFFIHRHPQPIKH